MPIRDGKVNEWIKDLQDVIRIHDTHGDDVDSCVYKMNELKDKINARNQFLLEKEKEWRKEIKTKKEQTIEVNKKMEDEIKPEKAKRGRKPKEGSYASYIEKALSMKTIKTLEEAAARVNEWKPGKTIDVVKRQIRAIINQVKLQKQPRWMGYKWNEEEYLLTKPEE